MTVKYTLLRFVDNIFIKPDDTVEFNAKTVYVQRWYVMIWPYADESCEIWPYFAVNFEKCGLL